MATYVLFAGNGYRIVLANPGKEDSSTSNGRKICIFEVIKIIDECDDFNNFNSHMFIYNRDSHGRYKEGAPYAGWFYDDCYKIDDKNEIIRLFKRIFK